MRAAPGWMSMRDRGGLRAHRDGGGHYARRPDVRTTTRGLLALADWLAAHGSPTWRWKRRACTGSPCGTCSKGTFDLSLANAQHVRNVPGRKSDVNDASGSRTCSRSG